MVQLSLIRAHEAISGSSVSVGFGSQFTNCKPNRLISHPGGVVIFNFMSSSFDKRHCCLLQVFFPNLDDLPGKPSPSPQIPPPSSSSSSSSSSVEMKMKTAPFPINITVNQAVGLIMERDRSRLQQVILHCNVTGIKLGLWDSATKSFLPMGAKLTELFVPGSYTQGLYLKPLPPEESHSTPLSLSPSPTSGRTTKLPSASPPLPSLKHSPSNDAVSSLAQEPVAVSLKQPKKKSYSKTYSSSDLMNAVVLPSGPPYSEEDLAPYLTWIVVSIEQPMMPAVFLPEVSTDSCVLLCHDYFEDLGLIMPWVQTMRKELGISVLAFEYSGFGLHRGKLDMKNWVEDAKASYNFLTNVKLVPSPGIVIYGKGSGCVVAANLVADLRRSEGRCPAALALQSLSQESLSLIRIANDVGPCPALFIHGELDEAVPIKVARKVATNFEAWQLLKVSGAGRTNLQREDFSSLFLPKLKEVLNELSSEKQEDIEDKHPSRVLASWLSNNRLEECIGPLSEVGIYSLKSLCNASSVTVSLGDPIICKRFERAVRKAEKMLCKSWEQHKALHDRKPVSPIRRLKPKYVQPNWSLTQNGNGHNGGHSHALTPKAYTPVPVAAGRTRRRSASVDGTAPGLTRPSVPQLTVFVQNVQNHTVESKDDMSTGKKRLTGLSSPFRSFKELMSARSSSPGT